MVKKIKNSVKFNFSLSVVYGLLEYLCSNIKRRLRTKFSMTIFIAQRIIVY